MRLRLQLFMFAMVCAANAQSFVARYAATLEPDEAAPRGYSWTTGADDVWRIEKLNLDLGDKFKMTIESGTLVIGRHDSDALWALLVPDAPTEIHSSLAGAGQHATSIWFRFHPARALELFAQAKPAAEAKLDTVAIEDALSFARRMAGWKLSNSYHTSGQPYVPPRSALVMDIETAERPRLFFTYDPDENELKHIAAFSTRGLPPDRPIDIATATQAFDKVWEAFDREFPLFDLRPNVDWAALREQYRPRAAAAKTSYALAAVIAEMLTKLEEFHIWVRCGAETLPGYNRERPLNANWKASDKLIGGLKDAGGDMTVGRTQDGIGCVNIFQLSKPKLPDDFDAALEKLGDAWGLIIDLRFNGGGDESLGRKVAGRFVDDSRVYSLSQFRSGPKHEDFGEITKRVVNPRGPWRYESPVIVLIGQKTMSSAESFALMLAQAPNVTLMGEHTAGSSANPKRLDLPGEIAVNMPRWLDMDPNGKPLDRVGVVPKIVVDAKPEQFTPEHDPVMEAALARLRAIPAEERKPGRR